MVWVPPHCLRLHRVSLYNINYEIPYSKEFLVGYLAQFLVCLRPAFGSYRRPGNTCRTASKIAHSLPALHFVATNKNLRYKGSAHRKLGGVRMVPSTRGDTFALADVSLGVCTLPSIEKIGLEKSRPRGYIVLMKGTVLVGGMS